MTSLHGIQLLDGRGEAKSYIWSFGIHRVVAMGIYSFHNIRDMMLVLNRLDCDLQTDSHSHQCKGADQLRKAKQLAQQEMDVAVRKMTWAQTCKVGGYLIPVQMKGTRYLEPLRRWA